MNYLNLGAWVFLSGLLFTLFSFFANKYHEQKRTFIQFFQDFLGGALFMSFIAVLIPDYFPDILKLLTFSTDTLSPLNESSSTNLSNQSPKVPDNTGNETSNTSLINLLPKIGGFMNSKSAEMDDFQLQLGPIPSGSLGNSVGRSV